jgi:LPXTG-site transpeptidase (sortase) family protein
MGLPYQRRKRHSFSWWQMILLVIGVVLIVFSWERISEGTHLEQSGQSATLAPGLTPTLPRSLSRADVLPTPTPDRDAPPRAIVFPAAALTSPIIEAIRTDNSWETRYLGNAVGHLEGTSWLNGIGGNIVLAGHVESETGAPGPFAYLFKVTTNDLVILQDGKQSVYYKVSTIVRAAPDDIGYVAQDGHDRLTLITCTDWDQNQRMYLGRLIVIAEPVATAAAPAGDKTTTAVNFDR